VGPLRNTGRGPAPRKKLMEDRERDPEKLNFTGAPYRQSRSGGIAGDVSRHESSRFEKASPVVIQRHWGGKGVIKCLRAVPHE